MPATVPIDLHLDVGIGGVREACGLARSRLRDLGVAVIPRGPRRSTAGHPFGLTSREEEVLQLLTEELSNQEIASRLVVSERTVHHHVSALLAKLQVRDRTQAALWAQRHHLGGSATGSG